MTDAIYLYQAPGGPLVNALVANVLGDTCSIQRRKIFEKVGGFPTNRAYFDDWEYFIKLVGRGYTHFMYPDPLFFYTHDNSGRRAAHTEYENHKTLWRSLGNLDPSKMRDMLEVLASHTLIRGRSTAETRHAEKMREVLDELSAAETRHAEKMREVLDELSAAETRHAEKMREVETHARLTAASRRELYAFRITRVRMLFGLLRRRIFLPLSMTRDRVRADARAHQLPKDDVENMVEWLTRFRVIVGLLRRKLMFRSAAAEQLVHVRLRKKYGPCIAKKDQA